ncbi:MAG: hypothetical protein COV35_06170 [Alphaproteobacteria bacterium CG11_big_fil_rev_8_21_14_0_20_39_49]|nr:MAG: hypothetical protein COV35_06170 [Alphaproteobacteria bacterium CG11_big_fil_rev_8_21_14_0_20_39_49]
MHAISKTMLIIPKFLAVFAVLIMCTQSRVYGFDNYFPAIDLMVIYYWCIYRPKLLGNGFVFLLGFFKDVLMGVSLGINALNNLIIRMMIVRKGGHFEPTFYFLWAGFAIILMISTTIQWLLFSFLAEQWLGIGAAGKQFAVSVLIYPFVHNFFNKIYSLLPRHFVNA